VYNTCSGSVFDRDVTITDDGDDSHSSTGSNVGLAVGTLVVDVFEIVDAERDQAQAEYPAT